MKEFQTMISAIEKGQQAGVYSLQEVQQILAAIGVVSKVMAESQVQEPKTEKTKK